MLDISIKTLRHSRQRYQTCGDYYEQDGQERIRVSDLGNWKYELLIAVHELLEDYLCKDRKISEGDITEFDVCYEEARDAGLEALCGCKPTKTSEPGNDKHAPYYKEHKFATQIEKLLAIALKVDWKKYDRAVSEL